MIDDCAWTLDTSLSVLWQGLVGAVDQLAPAAIRQRQPPRPSGVLSDESLHGLPVLGEPYQLIPCRAMAYAPDVYDHESVIEGQGRLVMPGPHVMIVRNRDPAMLSRNRYPVSVKGPPRDEVRDQWVADVGDVISQLLQDLADGEGVLVDDKPQLIELHE
jgi:hypothetical protein